MTSDKEHPENVKNYKALGLLALAAVVWMGYEGYALNTLSRPLQTPSAPRRIVSLALAKTPAEAQVIRLEWQCNPAQPPCRQAIATQALNRDTWFIASYVASIGLLVLWAALVAQLPWWLTGLLIALIVGAGIADLVENNLLLTTLADPAGPVDHEVTRARVAAMTKFVLFLFGVAGMLMAVGGAWRYLIVSFIRPRRAPAPTQDLQTVLEAARTKGIPCNTFAQMIFLENTGIFDKPEDRSADDVLIADHISADESRVVFRSADVVGLGLSGGGIRSATFNLGLLQGLHRLGVLKLFDYVSTVSGGGYIGSFWSEWLARQKAKKPEERELFPTHVDKDTTWKVIREIWGTQKVLFFEINRLWKRP
jgi:hypothetical protein